MEDNRPTLAQYEVGVNWHRYWENWFFNKIFCWAGMPNLPTFTDIHKSFTTVLDRAKIKKFRFHDLRHTVATRLVEKGIDLVVVKEILGHAKIDTTMRYAHAVPQRKLDAISVLNNYS